MFRQTIVLQQRENGSLVANRLPRLMDIESKVRCKLPAQLRLHNIHVLQLGFKTLDYYIGVRCCLYEHDVVRTNPPV